MRKMKVARRESQPKNTAALPCSSFYTTDHEPEPDCHQCHHRRLDGMEQKPPVRAGISQRLVRPIVRLRLGNILIHSRVLCEACRMEKLNDCQHQWRYEQTHPPKHLADRMIGHDTLLAFQAMNFAAKYIAASL